MNEQELSDHYGGIRKRLRNGPPRPPAPPPLPPAPPPPPPPPRPAGFRTQAHLDAAAADPHVKQKFPRVLDIKIAVSEFYAVPIIDIDSSRRQPSICYPRHMAMYLARTMTQHSYPEIARRFGGRDHTTIMHGVSSITTAITVDVKTRAEVHELKNIIISRVGA